MSKLLFRLLATAILPLLLSAGDCSPTDDDEGPTNPGIPGPVTNLEITAADDGAMVRLWWNAPVFGDPHDGYLVQFDPDSFPASAIDTLIVPPYVHDPGGVFGDYKVWAFNEESGRGEVYEVDFTAPRKRIGIELHDIHSSEHADDSGLGIHDLIYFGDGMDMSNPFFLVRTDIYMSNESTDSSSEPFYFKSPNLSQSPPDNDVAADMDEELPLTVCRDLGTDAPHLVPDGIDYYGVEEVLVGHYYSVKTWEDYRSVIYVEEIEPLDNGRVVITLWASTLQSSRMFYLD